MAETDRSLAGGSAREIRPTRLSIDALRTPIGRLAIVCEEAALCVVDYDDFGPRMHALLARRYGAYDLVRRHDPLGMTTLLARYFHGEFDALDTVRVEAGGTLYQRRVWELLRTIPAGQTRSYGQLAAQLGGTHARAVGQANALNPVAIVVPCHRVIGADATLTGYAGGLERKRWLLDHEARNGAMQLPFLLPT